ncbi:MAG: tetratricopeptide repeat protein [Candidatus Aminicenantes bacterium]|jgi:tetratricopeptide (TPR) repeat protein
MKIRIGGILLVCLSLAFCSSPEKKIQKQREQDPRYQYNLALFHLNNGQLDEAIKYFNKSLSLDAQYHLSYNGLGIAYLMKGEFKQAIDFFDRTLQLNPTLTEAHNYMGTAYQELGMLDKAEQAFRTAASDVNYKSRELPYYNLARLYFTQDRTKDALYYVQKSVEMNPRLVMAHNLQGVLYERLNDYDKAIDSYKAGIKIAEDDINLKFNLAVAYFKNNQHNLAREKFDEIYSAADIEMKAQIDEYLKLIK